MFTTKTQAGNESLVPHNKLFFICARKTKDIRNDANRELIRELLYKFHFPFNRTTLNKFTSNLLNERNKRDEALAHELPSDYVAQPAVTVAVSVFQNVRTKHVRRTKHVWTIGLIHRAIKALIVLKGGVDIVIATDDPTIMETITEQRMMIAEPLIQRKRITLKLWRVKLSWVNFVRESSHNETLPQQKYCFNHAAVAPLLLLQSAALAQCFAGARSP